LNITGRADTRDNGALAAASIGAGRISGGEAEIAKAFLKDSKGKIYFLAQQAGVWQVAMAVPVAGHMGGKGDKFPACAVQITVGLALACSVKTLLFKTKARHMYLI
jgi:hypothetical protein